MRRGALALTVAGLAVAASVSWTSAALARTVRVGAVAHPALAGVAPAVASGLRMHIAVTLRPRDPAALRAFDAAVSMPGSSQYRHYLSPAQFARRFGATAGEIGRVRAALSARGLVPGTVSAGGLSIPVVATVGSLERAFALSLRRLTLPGGRHAIAADAAPALSAGAATDVQSVVGLDTSWAPQPVLVRPRRGSVLADAAVPPQVDTGGPQPCAAAQAAAPQQTAYTINQIASAYSFAGMYGAGDEGAGTTIAVYELESDDPADIAAYQACYGTHTNVAYVTVDGGGGHGPGSGEAALDIENTIGLAPASHVIVYQGPNSNSSAPGSGPYDIFSDIINQDRANVVTVSWGECEPALGRFDAAAENALFEQATAQGQSIVAAAGDSGAQDCDSPGSAPNTRPAVDDPSSQPLVTGVGGTSLTALGPPPSETVWNNAGTPAGGILAAGASGGGVSQFWPVTDSQSDAAAALGVLKPVAAGPACGRPTGYCREVPDVAADADPNTGYEIYFNGAGTVHSLPAGWQGIGGTSGAAPVWAALLALADSSAACGGSRIGDADPALYRAASQRYAADFHDVITGDNDFAHTNDGQFAAGPGYDLASGLGTPNATALAATLCADTVRLAPLAPLLSAARSLVLTRLRASDARGRAVTFSARGLPPGLRLNRATGEISGRPAREGRFTVHVVARDHAGATASSSFGWAIGPAPRLVDLSAGAGPTLAFSVIAGRDGPAIRTLRLAFGAPIWARSRHGIRVSVPGHPRAGLACTVTAAHGVVTITLHRPAFGMRVTLDPPALAGATAGLGAGSRLGRLTVTVGDDGDGTSVLRAQATIA